MILLIILAMEYYKLTTTSLFIITPLIVYLLGAINLEIFMLCCQNIFAIHCNPSKMDTTGIKGKDFVLYCEVSLAKRLVADCAPLPIVANSNAKTMKLF